MPRSQLATAKARVRKARNSLRRADAILREAGRDHPNYGWLTARRTVLDARLQKALEMLREAEHAA